MHSVEILVQAVQQTVNELVTVMLASILELRIMVADRLFKLDSVGCLIVTMPDMREQRSKCQSNFTARAERIFLVKFLEHLCWK